MEIGSRLKNARNEMGLTQEKVAEELGVSRQSISNWENNRSYPDIISVIKMSDLYSISLDELLKEDKNMIRHLAESTDAVASNKQLIKRIILGVYWGFWVLMLLLFWVTFLNFGYIALPYGWSMKEIVYHMVFPGCMFVVTMLMGASSGFSKLRWLYVPITGGMFLVYDTLTWYMHSYLWAYEETQKPIYFFELICSYFMYGEDGLIKLFIGLGCSAVGLFAGTFIRNVRLVKAKKKGDKIIENKQTE